MPPGDPRWPLKAIILPIVQFGCVSVCCAKSLQGEAPCGTVVQYMERWMKCPLPPAPPPMPDPPPLQPGKCVEVFEKRSKPAWEQQVLWKRGITHWAMTCQGTDQGQSSIQHHFDSEQNTWKVIQGWKEIQEVFQDSGYIWIQTQTLDQFQTGSSCGSQTFSGYFSTKIKYSIHRPNLRFLVCQSNPEPKIG